MTESMVTLEGVTVSYGKNAALRDVTTDFPPGAVGLLGPNGAGKSTMIKSLLGFVVPDHGKMRVLGLDVAHSPLGIRARGEQLFGKALAEVVDHVAATARIELAA